MIDAEQAGRVSAPAVKSATPPARIDRVFPAGVYQGLAAVLFHDIAAPGQQLAHVDADDLDLARLYRALPEHEQERVWNAVQAAWRRVEGRASEGDWRAVEAFLLFADALEGGEAEARICELHELTPGQFERYLRAWESVKAVYEEVEALCAARDGR